VTARPLGTIVAAALVALLVGFASAQVSAEPAERVDVVWRLVAERYWDLSTVDVDWDEVRADYLREARAPLTASEVDALLERMVDELGDEHSRYLSAGEVRRVRDAFGDLPCVGVFSQAAPVRGREGPVAWRSDGRLGTIDVDDLARAGTAEGVRRAVTLLEAEGVEALVLDLRGNPGGRLVEMMRVAGVFVRGLLWRVVTSWSLPLPYPALGAPASDLPLAVLVDGSVASAAEGLAGALQASGRAVVVGETTSGNVEAVLPFCLRDGSQVWLATGVLAPLRGPTWEGRGVRPDVVAPAGQALAAARSTLLDGE
jgi:carboxyl-terminal processing protease